MISFAAFLYEDIASVMTFLPSAQVRFDSGDEIRRTDLNLDELNEVNVYRIDGT